jgi:hypothetical protein
VAITGTKDGIDQILTTYHQLHPLRINLGSMVAVRPRVLKNWQRAVDMFFLLRNWHWRYEDATIPALAINGNFLTLPSAWGNEGRDGTVWNVTEQLPIGWIGLRDISTMSDRYPNETGSPKHYSVRGTKMLLFPRTGQDISVHAQYQRKKPLLEDINGTTAEGYTNGGLQVIPEQWWDTVLYEYAAWLEMKHVGALNEAVVQKDLVENMVFGAVCEETQGKTTPDYMPRFPGSASVWEVE